MVASGPADDPCPAGWAVAPVLWIFPVQKRSAEPEGKGEGRHDWALCSRVLILGGIWHMAQETPVLGV